jgi:hypothetical protein
MLQTIRYVDIKSPHGSCLDYIRCLVDGRDQENGKMESDSNIKFHLTSLIQLFLGKINVIPCDMVLDFKPLCLFLKQDLIWNSDLTKVA